MGVFIGCRGDGGFNGRCSGASIGDGGFMLACISGCRGVIGFKVAMSRVLCAKKFALRARKGPKLAFYGVLGEFFRDNAARGASLGELCRATGLMLLMLGERCRAAGVASMPGTTRGSGQARRPQPGRSRSRVIAPNEPPAHASCGGGRQYEESSSNTQRNRCKRR